MNTKKIVQYIHQCRWCDFKKEIENDTVSRLNLSALPFDDNKKIFIVGSAEFTNKQKPKYFSMPLAVKEEEPQAGTKHISDDGKYYTDALVEPDFWQSFTKFLNENNGKITFPNGITLEASTIGTTNMFTALPEEPSKALGVEQSNTTLKIGDGQLAFKLERMLDFAPMLNAEYEMNEKLMRENVDFMPKTFGGLIWRTPDGKEASGGIVQEFVKNKGDMWNYLQTLLQDRLSSNYLHQTDLTAESNQDIMHLIRALNIRTQDMEKTLSREDADSRFSPTPVTDEFIADYKKALSLLLTETRHTIITNIHNLDKTTKDQARHLLQNWNELTNNFIEPKLAKIDASENKGFTHRVHGDYHLGQVMVTPDDDVKIIDFGGEPALSMSDRKQKYISVRDLAGMYRSIKGYLGAVAVEDWAKTAPTETIAQERKSWGKKAIKPLIDRASSAFLGDQKLSDPWLSLEILRKNLYEVKYEVAFRPEMAYVPIQGLSELFTQNQLTHANENIQSTSFDRAE